MSPQKTDKTDKTHIDLVQLGALLERNRTELTERRLQISVKYQRAVDQLDSELAVLNAAEELVKKLVKQLVAPRSNDDVPEQVPDPASRPPRQLNRPSGITSGQIPPRWTPAEEDRVLSADPGDDALLAVELDRSVAAIRKQRTIARRRREESIPVDADGDRQEESSSETEENFEASDHESKVPVQYQDQEPAKEQEPVKEQAADAPPAAHHPALDRYRSWGR
jgi:hypothetical protein